MSKIGRNIPCPCGSGKKYKQCCLSRVSESKPGRSGHSVSVPDQTSPIQKLIAFVDRPEFDADREVAQMLFWGPWLAERTEEEMQNVLQLPQSEIMFNAWLVFDMDHDDGRTLADVYLNRQSSDIPPADRAYLQQVMNTHIGLYEVEEVRRDEGFRLKDVWTESRMWVHERRATEVIRQWDLLAARLMKPPLSDWVMEVGAFQYPPTLKDVLIKELKKEYRKFHRRFPQADDRDFFKRVGFLFCHWWLEHVIFKPFPQLQTAEGDELVLTKVVFDIVDRNRLSQALQACPALERLKNELYDWWEDAPSFRRTLGTIRIDAHRLVLETFSDERATRGRKLIEGAAGEAVRYRATAFEDVKQALEQRRGRPLPERRSPIPTHVETEALRQFYERHYRQWPDRSLPALKGKTPRQAAALKTLRPTLIAILKDMENHQAHADLENGPPYDFTWLWEELGLQRDA